MPYAKGRRSPSNKPALMFAEFLTATAGTVTDYPAIDYLGDFTDWQMLGNDTAGDCAAVSWANDRALTTAVLTGTAAYPTQDQVWALYKSQNPDFNPNGTTKTGPGSPADNGMDLQTMLEHLVAVGGPDGVKAVGFAKIDHTNLAEIKAAISTGGSVIFGVNLQDAQQTQFDSGIWDYDPSSQTDGGHAFIVGGHLDEASNDLCAISWAKQIGLTDAFTSNLLEEAWLVIWPEHLGSKEFLAGMDLQAFAAAYTAITGKPFPATVPPSTVTPPAPPVTPVPAPAPVPTPPAPEPVPSIINEIEALSQELLALVIRWIDTEFHDDALERAMKILGRSDLDTVRK